MPASRARTIAYWITTVLFCFPMAAGGVMDLLQPPEAIEIMKQLGYPQYLLVIIGVAKPLGVILVLAPGLPRLKEWAYAGLIIDLVGASASHAFVGDPIFNVATPILIGALGMVSWYLRPESRRLPSRAELRAA
jgi:uncharacterized membrane protein YphA (DoxX/SURF4 family)